MSSRALAMVASAAVAASLSGCDRAPDSAAVLAGLEGAGTVTTLAPREDPASGGAGAPTLGPHRRVERFELTVSAADSGAGPWRLVAERTVDRFRSEPWRTSTPGPLSLRDRRWASRPGDVGDALEDGREARWDGRVFATRRLGGPWIRWPERGDPWGGGVERWLRESTDGPSVAIRVWGDYARWRPVEAPARSSSLAERHLAGVAVDWYAASLDPEVAPALFDDATLAQLRDHTDPARWSAALAATYGPVAIEGSVAVPRGLSPGPGVPLLAGELRLRGLRRPGSQDPGRPGDAAPWSARVRWSTEPLPGGAAPPVIPSDAMAAERPRPWHHIETVLGDALAPAYRP